MEVGGRASNAPSPPQKKRQGGPKIPILKPAPSNISPARRRNTAALPRIERAKRFSMPIHLRAALGGERTDRPALQWRQRAARLRAGLRHLAHLRRHLFLDQRRCRPQGPGADEGRPLQHRHQQPHRHLRQRHDHRSIPRQAHLRGKEGGHGAREHPHVRAERPRRADHGGPRENRRADPRPPGQTANHPPPQGCPV
jgi:hypothetical protein